MMAARRVGLIAAAVAVLGAFAAPAWAEVAVADAWVRATVAQQKATGAFVTLTSSRDAKLVAAASPVAGVVEIHEMVMAQEVMKMRQIDALALPAGKAVTLAPGGHHVMLLNLKAQVREGDQIPLTLVIEEGGERSSLNVTAAVRPLGHTAGPAAKHQH